MKFEMEQSSLAEMAGKVKKIASDSLPAEILRGVYLECDEEAQEVSMIATDASMSVFLKEAAKVRESGRIVINARLLFDIISHAPGNTVSFQADYKRSAVEIRSGQSAYNILFLSAEDYPKPDMPFPEDTVRISGICGLAAKIAFAVNEDSPNKALSCVGKHRQLRTADKAGRGRRGGKAVPPAQETIFEARGDVHRRGRIPHGRDTEPRSIHEKRHDGIPRNLPGRHLSGYGQGHSVRHAAIHGDIGSQ